MAQYLHGEYANDNDEARMLQGRPATTGDDYPLNMTSLFRYAARTFPDNTVTYRDFEGTWHRSSYREEFTRIARMAHALTRIGVEPGDTVGVLDWNSQRHLELYFAVPALAATMLQLNLRLATEDLGYVIDHSEATWVCVDESLLPMAEAHRDQAKIKGWIVMSDRPSNEIETSLPNVAFLEDLMNDESEEDIFERIDEKTAAYAGYTTGTTGRPKGILYSHRAMYLHSLGVVSSMTMTYNSTVMLVTPMFHVMCWGFPQAAVAAGARIVLPGRWQAQDIAVLGDALAREAVTVTNAAPSILTPLLEYFRSLPEPPRLDGLSIICGASEPPLSLMRGFKEVVGADVVHAYGASETSPLVSTNRELPPALQQLGEDEAWDVKRSQGLPMLGAEVKIVDLEGRPQPHDGESAGELLVRGPWITTSYVNRPDTQDCFDDGWWRSGDVGVIDARGYIKLTDRLKDVIKSGGEWISSIDMENTIVDHPDIAEAAVIGVPDETWDERPVAYVVPRPGTNVTEASVYDLLGARFAKWQLPEQVIIANELPRTSVGKLNKRQMRADFAAGKEN
ncbi:long-chain-fatty-acid--CoA ligase [Kocuria sp. HSID16901]|uniref:long-chain-fatty-acid--CoA ligase n=1 Tax=Kocuria sp. HSID16901 TaxID=2419505 RepID=UPI001EE86D81|nr:long-chain-fatty-acid--CoA ligase [Kocuria sp. HSID16901]MCT1368093.1 long-chain-fatty-acid--CoA ligase [Rothia sp. p3-SID1597]